MKNRDANDALTAILAMLVDFCTIWVAQMLAVWIRFDSGWMSVPLGREPDLYRKYAAAAAALPIYLAVFQRLALLRPQYGNFNEQDIAPGAPAPRACSVSSSSALLKNKVPYFNAAILVSFVTVTAGKLLERALMFQLRSSGAPRGSYNRA